MRKVTTDHTNSPGDISKIFMRASSSPPLGITPRAHRAPGAPILQSYLTTMAKKMAMTNAYRARASAKATPMIMVVRISPTASG
jgi:hypothetical protein